MNPLLTEPFPLAAPGPTAFYLTLYLATLALHFAFMHYVLAGTAYAAWCALRGSTPEGQDSFQDGSEITGYSIVRDWLPVMLSGAITAGIAPLLFLQILYKESFYTANLLLFHRWMAILPVLIVGFYALYLMKWKGRPTLPLTLLRPASVIPLLAMLFTGYTWTVNHQLSLQSAARWAEYYGTEITPLAFSTTTMRMVLWFALSVPTFALVLAWQLRHHAIRQIPLAPQSVRKLSILALSGLSATVVCGLLYLSSEPAVTRFSYSYLALALIGFAAQALCWLRLLQRERFALAPLLLGSFGLASSLFGIVVVREDLRLQTIDPERMADLYAAHAKAATIGGMGAFLACLALNTALTIFCFLLVRRQTVA